MLGGPSVIGQGLLLLYFHRLCVPILPPLVALGSHFAVGYDLGLAFLAYAERGSQANWLGEEALVLLHCGAGLVQ